VHDHHDSSITLALTEILRERWRAHAWEDAPPPPFRNIQYIATALFVLRMKGLIDGIDPAPAVEILSTGLPSASEEEILFTFAILQEQGVFSPAVYEAAHCGAAQIDF